MSCHCSIGDLVLALISDAYPLSKLQQGMIFHGLLDPERGAYHEVLSSRLRAHWDQSNFCAALQALTARHDVLRSVFRIDLSPPLQQILRNHDPVLEVEDLRQLDEDAQNLRIRDFIDAGGYRL